MNSQRLAHQALGCRQGTRRAPVSFGHGQQFGAVEQPWLQQIDPLQPRIHLQTIEPVRRDGLAVDVEWSGKAVTEIIQRAPSNDRSNGSSGTTFGQGQQGGGIVIEYTGKERIFGGQQANQRAH